MITIGWGRKAATFRLITTIIIFGIGMAQVGVAVAVPGDLDLSFGVDGKVTTDISFRAEKASGVAIQTDGKIVTVGSGTGDFTVVRYNQDGTLDPTFGNGGIVLADLGDPFDDAFGVALQSDGRIVVVGGAGLGKFVLARFNTDGSLDTGFDGDGRVMTDFGSIGGNRAFAVAIQSDGKIIAAGNSEIQINRGHIAMARYNVDGSLDTTFGTGGRVMTDLESGGRVHGVLIQEDGKIIIVGGTNFESDFLLVRYNVDGSLDQSFGSDGKVLTDFGSHDTAFDAALQDDGKIIAAGVGSNRIALARYTSNGFLDTEFDGDGMVITEFFGENIEQANGLAIQENNKMVIVGSVFRGADPSFAIARYNPNGTLDLGFGSDGKVTTDFGDPADVGVLCPPARRDCSNDLALDVAIQGDGKIVAVGGSGAGTPTPFHAVARYLGDVPSQQPCDVNQNGQIDRHDLLAIFAARESPSSGPDDPRDADGDGTITGTDARQCLGEWVRGSLGR